MTQSKTLQIDGFIADSVKALNACLQVQPAATIFVDFMGRGIAPFSAGEQACAQLDTTAADLLDHLPNMVFSADQFGSTTAVEAWLDFEFFGDPERILVDRICSKMDQATFSGLVFMMPASANHMRGFDWLLFRQLAALGKRQNKLVLVIFYAQFFDLPEELGLEVRLTGNTSDGSDFLTVDPFFPGLMGTAFATKLTMLGCAPPDSFTTPSGFRLFLAIRKEGTEPAYSGLIQQLAQDWGWNGAPFRVHTASSAELTGLAWSALAERDMDLAQRLVDVAIQCDPSNAEARQTKGMLAIIAQAYDTLHRQPVADEDLPIFGIWGNAVAGDARRALIGFDSLPQAEVAGAAALFYLNLRALAHARSGELEVAWSLQHELRDRLAADPDSSQHIQFLNCLNMGRLSRFERNYEKAFRLIERAFACREGMLSEHDELYRLVLLAQCHAEQADRRALYQQACQVFDQQDHPGAIPKRNFQSIVGRAPGPLELREQAVHTVLTALAEGKVLS